MSPSLSVCLLANPPAGKPAKHTHLGLSCRLPPQLLHLCLTSADSANPLVRRDSQQLLVYLLYSLSLKHLEAAQVNASFSQGLHCSMQCAVISMPPCVSKWV